MFTRRLVTRLRVSQEPIAPGWSAGRRIRSQWTAMTRKLSSHQKTRKVSDAGSSVRRHQLLGPETATPRRWVKDA